MWMAAPCTFRPQPLKAGHLPRLHLPTLSLPSQVAGTSNHGPSDQDHVWPKPLLTQAPQQLNDLFVDSLLCAHTEPASAINKVAKTPSVATRSTYNPGCHSLPISDDIKRLLHRLGTVGTMRINCFRASPGKNDRENDEPPRTPSKKYVRRSASGQSAASRCSTASNASISKLPPCKGRGDPRVEALMMPIPAEPRPSKCMRLSRPKAHGDIVDSMKASKGCRDWKNFPVFHDLEIDMSKSAEDYARAVRGRTARYEQTGQRPNLGSNDSMYDMIG